MSSYLRIEKFDWDSGNWPKCAKHGVSKKEIEDLLLGEAITMQDPSISEERMRAIGTTKNGRNIFVVFTIRNGKLRPISARYMHIKEVNNYDKT